MQRRIEGWSYRKIADHYKVQDSTVWEAVTRELRAIRTEPAEELRTLELNALDWLIDQALNAVEAGELDRIEQVRKLRADRRKLLGLDAPVKSEVSIQSENVSIEELRELLRPLGWDVVPLSVQTTGESVDE